MLDENEKEILTAAVSEYETLVKKEADLVKEREELRDESGEVRKRFSEMRRRARHSNKYADPKTFQETENEVLYYDGEMKRVNLEIMTTQRRLGELKRMQAHMRSAEDKSEPTRKEKYGMFHEVAKEILPADTFLRIWQIVDGRLRMGEKAELA